MELRQWRALFPQRILERGLRCDEQGAVAQETCTGGVIRAAVQGSGDYEVELALEGERIQDWECTCPYGAGGTPCKHLAAVFRCVEQGALVPRPSMESLVAGLDEGQAKALLARLDSRVERAIRRALKGPGGLAEG